MPPTPPARLRPSHTSRRTSSVRPPMRSRPHVLLPRKESARSQGDSSAGGSTTSSRTPFASSYSTTSGCGTTSAGRYSTAESEGRAQLVRRRDTAECDGSGPEGAALGKRGDRGFRVAQLRKQGNAVLAQPWPAPVFRRVVADGDRKAD